MAVKRGLRRAVRLLVPHRLLNILAALSLLLFLGAGVLCIAGLLGRPWVVTHGTIAGGRGFANGAGHMIFWTGDLTGVNSRAVLDDWSFPGALYRRVRGPQASHTLFVAHWLVMAATGAPPLAAYLIKRRRARRRVGFNLSADAVGPNQAGPRPSDPQADCATGATLSRPERGSS